MFFFPPLFKNRCNDFYKKSFQSQRQKTISHDEIKYVFIIMDRLKYIGQWMSKNGHNRPIMDRYIWPSGAKSQIMTKIFFFLQNTTHNGGSIKNPMNPKRKTKLYTAKKNFFPYLAYIEKYRQSKSKNHQLLAHKWNKPRK